MPDCLRVKGVDGVLDVILALAFLVLPLLTWWLSRSVTFTAVGLILGFGIAGNVVQSTIAMGVSWQVRGLQVFALAVMVLLGVLGLWRRGRISQRSMKSQLIGIGIPIAVIGLGLVVMRLLAPEDPGALTGLGYLINHPMGEDNAKFLNLAAQLADGREIAFNGYAAGPLLLFMSMVAAGISALSIVFLGGVNEVAVVLNTVIGSQHLMMVLTPVAFAPLAEKWRSSRFPMIPAPLVWTGIGVLFLANAVLTEYGHLSLQFVLILLVLWSLTFLADAPWWARLSTTLAIATTASVWLPLNVLGLLLIGASLIWTIRSRIWLGVAAALVVLVASWDSLISSLLFMLGIRVGSDTGSGSTESATAIDLGPVSEGASAVLDKSTEIFAIGGGTESVKPLLGVLAVIGLMAAVVMIRRWLGPDSSEWAVAGRFAPFIVFAGYVLAITLGDAISSGSGAHYGALKIAFALAVMSAAAYVPIAGMALSADAVGMTALRWIGILGVLLLLTWDSLLPRALSAISPARWVGVSISSPIYWSAAEVKPVSTQPISELPVACVLAPPHSVKPTALPWGQETYACTRLLLGMNGLEGKTSITNNWLGTEWAQQKSIWDEAYEAMPQWTEAIANRPVIVLNKDAQLAGLTTFADLIRMNPPAAN